MKTTHRSILASGLLFLFIAFSYSCSVFRPKYGCPANGKAVGAERILSGEKVPKAKKFRA
jgi:hypothetical protein